MVPKNVFSFSVKRWSLLLKTSWSNKQKFRWYLFPVGALFFIDPATSRAFWNKFVIGPMLWDSSLVSRSLWHTISIGTISEVCLGTAITIPYRKSQHNILLIKYHTYTALHQTKKTWRQAIKFIKKYITETEIKE